MSAATLGYRISTGLFALAMAGSGVAGLTGASAQAFETLGFPLYFAGILGIWKVLGVLAITLRTFERLEEWAYAGFFFTLTGAAASHVLAAEPVAHALPPVLLLGLGAASYAFRPAASSFVSAEAPSAPAAVAA